MPRRVRDDWVLSAVRTGRRRATKRRRVTAGPFPFHRRLRVEALEDRRLLSITVDILLDELDGSIADGDVSLRDAIAAAPSGETIDFGVIGVLELTLGELVIDKDLTIIGPPGVTGTVTIPKLPIFAYGSDPTPFVRNGDGNRVFNVDDGNDANLIDVEIINLSLSHADVAGVGGAVRNRERLTIRDSIISNNAAPFGGGVANDGGVLTIENCLIINNVADNGGGIDNFTGDLTVSNSTITSNSADVYGGGVRVLVNSPDSVVIAHSTITENRADAVEAMVGEGGGIYVVSLSDGTVELDHTIVAGNTRGAVTGDDIVHAAPGAIAARYSLVGDNAGSGLAECRSVRPMRTGT